MDSKGKNKIDLLRMVLIHSICKGAVAAKTETAVHEAIRTIGKIEMSGKLIVTL